jgi:hypothetical protein
MTDFGLAVPKTQQAAGNQPQGIEKGNKKNSHRNVCALLTCLLMGDPLMPSPLMPSSQRDISFQDGPVLDSKPYRISVA